MYIENIVIGKSIIEPSSLFAINEEDWYNIEKEKNLLYRRTFSSTDTG